MNEQFKSLIDIIIKIIIKIIIYILIFKNYIIVYIHISIYKFQFFKILISSIRKSNI